MDGMIAQIMASEHKDRVLSLTSIMSSAGNSALPEAAPDATATMMQPMPILPPIDPASCREVQPLPDASPAQATLSTRALTVRWFWKSSTVVMIPPDRPCADLSFR
jgi:hypothetical protein